MALGSAFQKVNFLRDLKEISKDWNALIFPTCNFNNLMKIQMQSLYEIEMDFETGLEGFLNCLRKLVLEFIQLINTTTSYSKTKENTFDNIQKTRIRVPNYQKMTCLLVVM